MMLSIPPKFPVLPVVGWISGKSPIDLVRAYWEQKRKVVAQNIEPARHFGSTVGRDPTVIGEYIWIEGEQGRRLDQLYLRRWLATDKVARATGAPTETACRPEPFEQPGIRVALAGAMDIWGCNIRG